MPQVVVGLADYEKLPVFSRTYPGRMTDDLKTLTLETVKRTWEPANWLYLTDLHRRRAAGRLSEEAFNNAVEARLETIIGELSIAINLRSEQRAAHAEVADEEEPARKPAKKPVAKRRVGKK